ncbi:TPA: DNA-3-methyladenine glycosylase I [Candidatus Uhrbacteria bacterium]|nr:DNA-3-methyladenine glycosylase I [Candidatus Uhrbacteria bacterium]
MPSRCAWVPLNDPFYVAYHDTEWGVPVHDDAVMFEFLLLESAQAGLSWKTVLHKRANYRRLFANFDPAAVALFTDADLERLLLDPGIIRNRAKIKAAIGNARTFLAIQAEFGSFCNYLWAFVDNQTIDHRVDVVANLPARSELSDAVAKDLKARGFSFLGSTVIYAHLQATGLINDHTTDCFRHDAVS